MSPLDPNRLRNIPAAKGMFPEMGRRFGKTSAQFGSSLRLMVEHGLMTQPEADALWAQYLDQTSGCPMCAQEMEAGDGRDED